MDDYGPLRTLYYKLKEVEHPKLHVSWALKYPSTGPYANQKDTSAQRERGATCGNASGTGAQLIYKILFCSPLMIVKICAEYNPPSIPTHTTLYICDLTLQ